MAGPSFLLPPSHQQDKTRKASGQWGAKDRQKLGVATFLVISSIWGQNELGIPSFSANFPKRVLFVPCVYFRGLNITPFLPSVGGSRWYCWR